MWHNLLWYIDANELARVCLNIEYVVQRIHRTAHLAMSVQIFMKSVCQRSLVF